MGVFRWLVGGLIGGATGIAIWVLVGYFTHYEVGWIAWGVGFMTGVGVRYAAYLQNEEASIGKGLLASLMAIAAILTAKYLVFLLLVGGKSGENLRPPANRIRFDDEAMIAANAADIAEEAESRGEKVDWPAGISLDTAAKQKDFPASIWQKAQLRWNQLGSKGQQDQKKQRAMLAMVVAETDRKPTFAEFFTAFDILWFGLAILTAYKIGVGTYGNE